MKYQLDDTVAKEPRSENLTKSLREQELFVQSDIDKYRQGLPLYTERFTADVTEGFSNFLFCLGTEVKKSVAKQRKDVKTTVKTDVEAIDSVLCSIESKLSRPDTSW